MASYPNPPIVSGTPADGQVVAYDAATDQWVPVDQTGGGGGSKPMRAFLSMEFGTPSNPAFAPIQDAVNLTFIDPVGLGDPPFFHFVALPALFVSAGQALALDNPLLSLSQISADNTDGLDLNLTVAVFDQTGANSWVGSGGAFIPRGETSGSVTGLSGDPTGSLLHYDGTSLLTSSSDAILTGYFQWVVEWD